MSIQFSRRFLFNCTLGLLGLFAAQPASAATYTFEGLTNGALATSATAGQDNWKLISGPSPVVTNGTGLNTTKVASNPGTAGNTIIWRQNNANFSFTPFTGTETAATLTMDFYLGSTSTSGQSFFFGLGHDANSNAILENNETSPTFGILSGNYNVRGASLGTLTASAAIPTADRNSWMRLKLEMNFVTGKMSLSKLNLTLNQTVYTTISGLQNINMEMNLLVAGAGPSTWDAIYFRDSYNTSPVGSQLADNLTIVTVPEPASLATLTLAGLTLLARRRR